MKLIIAEKPMLARAIASALDGTAINHKDYTEKGDYAIVSAFGHLLTLKDPEDYDPALAKWSLEDLPLYFENWGKKPQEGKSERLALIGDLLKDAELVIHAGDPDDEGQYLIDEILEWHGYKGPVLRLATGDTTEGALRKALTDLKDNSFFVNAGRSAHARSVADMMVGYNFSRYFSLKNPHVKMLTVGRVQTPTLGLVVTRDMAIENHKKLGYFTVGARLDLENCQVDTILEPAPDDPNLDEGKITDPDYAAELVKTLDGSNVENVKITMKEITEQPPLPFNLVKLQTYCSNKFGYDPSQVLEITQTLRDNYNAITYNRSDCRYLSEEQYKTSPAVLAQVRNNLKDDPAGKIFSSLKTDASIHSRAFNDANITAHTAIIPTNKSFDISKLSEEQRNVYLAICKYFFAQFLENASKERTTLEAKTAVGTLKASSTKVTSPGYLALIKPEKKKSADKTGADAVSSQESTDAGEAGEQEEESDLSLIAPGTYSAYCSKAWSEAKETKAPPRYTKASLNEDMTRIAKYVTDPKAKALLMEKDRDKKGENGSIGTSATRASIIDSLEQRGFIESRRKQIRSTRLGRELYRILPEELKKPDMTGLWWAMQQEIRDGASDWTVLTDSVLGMIKNVLNAAHPQVDAYNVPEEMRRGPLPLGTCPRCGEPIIEGKQGFGCSGFRSGCRFTVWKTAKSGMMSKVEITPSMVHEWLSGEWKDEIRTDENGAAVSTGRKRTVNTVLVKRLYSESKNKTYPGTVYLTDEGTSSQYGAGFGLEDIVREPPKPLGACPRCGKPVIEGKLGYGCSGYTEGCSFVIWKKAKSGMMSKQKITVGVVKNLLKSKWIDETKDDGNGGQVRTGRKRTEKTVHIRKLYSQAKDTTYSGDVYLADEGPDSKYGASFVLAGFSKDEPEVLGKCPRCGKPVIEGKSAFGCSGFKDGCRFAIWMKQKQKMLANITFTRTDAKKFLSGKPVRKRKLLDEKGREFTAMLTMEERADNPYGPVFRVIEGTIEVPEGESSVDIKIDTVNL